MVRFSVRFGVASMVGAVGLLLAGYAVTSAETVASFDEGKSLRAIATATYRHQRREVVDARSAVVTFVSRHRLSEATDGDLYLLYTNFYVEAEGETGGEGADRPIQIAATVEAKQADGRYAPPQPVEFTGFVTEIEIGPRKLAWGRVKLGRLPAGAEIRVRTRRTALPNGYAPAGQPTNRDETIGFALGDHRTGDLPALSSGRTPYGPTTIASFMNNAPAGVGLVGDSILAGRGDPVAEGGWAVRRLEELGIGYVQVARGGDRAVWWSSRLANRPARFDARDPLCAWL